MAKKFTLEDVQIALEKANLPAEQSDKIIIDLQAMAREDEKEEKEPAARSKKPFVLIGIDKEQSGKIDNTLLYVLQLKNESVAFSEVLERVSRAGYEYNQTRKGKKNPFKTLGEVLQECPKGRLSKQNILIKTQEPVLVIRSDNKLV